MSGIHQATVCAPCVRYAARYIELVHEAHEDGSSVWRCPNCLSVGILYSSMGILDLNLWRDEKIEELNDYRMFSEVFESSPSVGIVRSSVVSDVASYELYGESRWWRRLLGKLWPW